MSFPVMSGNECGWSYPPCLLSVVLAQKPNAGTPYARCPCLSVAVVVVMHRVRVVGDGVHLFAISCVSTKQKKNGGTPCAHCPCCCC